MTSLSTTDRPPAPPGSATGRPMRVLLVTAGDPDRFRRLGGGTDSSYPKHELAYPYYGLLLEQGLEVNITTMRYRDLRSVHKVARSLRQGLRSMGHGLSRASLRDVRLRPVERPLPLPAPGP